MALIEWTVELSVGFPEIDDDHKRLVRIYNDLYLSIKRGSPREKIEDALRELIAYTDWHFKHEEEIMKECDYPGYEGHKLEHRELTDHAIELQTQYLNGDDSVVEILIPFLRNWLTNHLMGTDKKLGQHLVDAADSCFSTK